MIHLVRAVYLIVVLAFTVSYAMQPHVYDRGLSYTTWFILIPTVMAFGLVMVDMFWREKRLQSLSGLFFGLLAGLFIAWVLSQIITLTRSVFLEGPDMATPIAQSTRVVVLAPNGKLPAISETQPTTSNNQQDGEATAPEAKPAETYSVRAKEGSNDASSGSSQPGGQTSWMGNSYAVMSLLKVLVGASAVFMCVSFVLQTRDDFRFVIPYVEFSKQTKGARPILLDTSVIIDGRIADIAETKIFESQLIVPRFVLSELQAVADSEDKLRRNRGRRGLDVLNRLQNNKKSDIKIMDAHAPAVDDAPDVDAKLVALASHMDGRVLTNDYNLNKIAQLRGVDVININDLANALKPVVLPGETMVVKILKTGEEPGQGVGYLEDGTMVVAEQGRDHVGREIAITVTSVLQTSAGRMIFGRADGMSGVSRPRRS